MSREATGQPTAADGYKQDDEDKERKAQQRDAAHDAFS